MNSLLAITARELRLRWTLLPAALSLGFVPLLGPVLGFRFAEPQLVGLVLSVLMGALAALLTGASVIGGDLGSGRLGFFFSRPLPWWAIWGGKLLAAILLTLGAGLLAAVPWMAWGQGGSLGLRSLWAMVILVGLAHAASVAYRSRSAWLLVDLALLAALVLLIRACADLIVLTDLALNPGQPFRPLFVVIGLALVLASAFQMAWGRTDPRRGHRALSVSLWTMLFLAVGSLAGFALWAKSWEPGDLRLVVGVDQVAPQGDWIEMTGNRGRLAYGPTFLYDTATGHYVRLDDWPALLSFSPRGDRAVSVSVDWTDAEANVRVVNLADRTWIALLRPELGPLTDLPLPCGLCDRVRALAFDPTGNRLAVVRGPALSVFELPSGRLLTSVPAGSGGWRDVVFLEDNRLRGLRRSGDQDPVAQIVEIRLPGGQTEVTGQVTAGAAAWIQWDDAGERILVFHQTEPMSVTLHNGRSGALLATLGEPGTRRSANGGFLSDGRIAVVESRASTRLRILSSTGEEEWALTLAEGPLEAHLGGEIAVGRLVVGLHGRFAAGNKAIEVDLIDRKIAQSWDGLDPVLGHLSSGPFGTMADRVKPGEPGTHLFLSPQRGLLRVNPTTGERTVLLGGRGGN